MTFRTISPAPSDSAFLAQSITLHPRRHTAAVDEDFPDFGSVGTLDAIGVQAEHGGAAAEFSGNFGEQIGIFHGGGIEAHFFRASLDQIRRVVEGANAAAYGQGHENLVHDLTDQVGHDLPPLVAGGDVVEDQFVRAILLIFAGLGDGVAGVDVVEEFDAFDDAPAINVQTGNDTFGQHDLFIPALMVRCISESC